MVSASCPADRTWSRASPAVIVASTLMYSGLILRPMLPVGDGAVGAIYVMHKFKEVILELHLVIYIGMVPHIIGPVVFFHRFAVPRYQDYPGGIDQGIKVFVVGQFMIAFVSMKKVDDRVSFAGSFIVMGKKDPVWLFCFENSAVMFKIFLAENGQGCC